MASEYLKKLQADLGPVQRLEQIVEHAMCIGCGICQSIAGPDILKMELVENGNLRPVANDRLSHEMMDKILDICPGTRVDGLPPSEWNDSGIPDPVWGVLREVCYAWSAEPEVRHRAATGGLLTGLALYLIESGEVDFILHACASRDHPAFGERFISRSREEVLKGSGSRYGPTATVIDVVEVIEKAEASNETFAFIGTPCDVGALRNYARHDERVAKTCQYMMVMVCGGFMDPEGARTVLKKFDVEYDQVVSLRYRGYGCPGKTRIETEDGQVVEMNYLDYWGEEVSTWGLPPRCKVCPDGIGDSADIAAADTWDGGAPPWTGQEDDPGYNAAIVRTRRGTELMARAVAAGYVARGEAMSAAELNRVQPHQENKKRSVWARFQGLKEAGHIVPDTQGLRIRSLHEENDPAFNEHQRRGSRERAAQGKFSEATPRKGQDSG